MPAASIVLWRVTGDGHSPRFYPTERAARAQAKSIGGTADRIEVVLEHPQPPE